MDTVEILRLMAATGCGMQIGGFMLLSLFHNPLLKSWPQSIELNEIFKRFYRFNTIVSIISGSLAIFGEARSTGFLLAILGMSYILLITHLLPAMAKQHKLIVSKKPQNTKRPPHELLKLLHKLQLIAHFSQLMVVIYIVYRLSISTL